MLKVSDKNENTRFFKFKLENDLSNTIYIIPQTTVDGSDTIQFNVNWSRQNLPGSTEPMVAYNYTDAPTANINLKFHEDMWAECGLNISGYLDVINKFAALAYPSTQGSVIKPPYVMLYFNNYVYRGYFTSIRVNQSGVIRNGHKTTCEITSSFVIIKKYAPQQKGVANGFRLYFTD